MSMLRSSPAATLALFSALLMSGCASNSISFGSFGGSSEPPPAAPATGAPLPASIPAQDLVGRWGLAAYHKEEDRGRTEAAARGQCRNPYNIGRGPTGGIIMHLADQSQPTELILKGGPDGKNYIGKPDEPAGGASDREIVSFDGRVLVTKFVDQEVAGRYGTSVYVRCAAAGTAAPKGTKKKAAAAPKQ
jgi:hypothetical protein